MMCLPRRGPPRRQRRPSRGRGRRTRSNRSSGGCARTVNSISSVAEVAASFATCLATCVHDAARQTIPGNPAAARARFFSWTVTHQALHPAFAADVPFVAAVVELEEGVRMATRLVDCERDRLALDLPVDLAFELIGGDFRLPVFRPREG